MLLSAHHFVLYSAVVIKHLQEECDLYEQNARGQVGPTADDFLGVEAVS
jgi:hypothetical protein